MAASTASDSAHALLHHLTDKCRRATLRATTATPGPTHALLHHLANVRRRAALLASGLLHLPDKLRFPDPFNSPGDLQFLAALVGASFCSAFFLGVDTFMRAAIFFTVPVARRRSPHPDQQGGCHSNYLV
jgi:hypothetical protein